MRLRKVVLLLTLLSLAGCSTNTSTAPTSSAVVRAYNGTASVGDFLTITLDSTAKTISYTDISNGETGVVPYTVNADGTYTLNDSEGNLIAAYEVPNYALLIQAAKTGPTEDAPALITAVESGQISAATFESHAYNFMQFRTAAGGLNVGSVNINAQGVGSTSTYWPYGAHTQSGGTFNTGTINVAQAQEDPSGTFLKMPDSGGYDYVFGTANGIFAVDTGSGAILGLLKAASKNFDPTFVGTYKAIYYQKTGASTGAGNVETGTPSLDNAVITVTSGGQVTITDTQGNKIVQAGLTPVADAPYLYGSAGELQDPCYGVFTFRVTTASSQQDVFVTFMGNALLFSSFQANLPWTSGGTYNYFYGVGLK
ncbi:MAG: hypothetical protein WBM11_06480 [Terriglobales bacterium]